MKVYPAIDLLGGKAVRLHQGKREDATVYSDAPVELFSEFVAAGAERIHVVDLDGAFSGHAANRELIARMIATSSVPVQVGGGIRDREALEAVFALGAAYAVIGTAAIKNKRFVRKACHDFPGKIIVAVDTDREGMVSVEGWSESGGLNALELATRVSVWGAAGILYTDISRDGTGAGPNVQATAALAGAVEIPVIASGGVDTIKHLQELAIADVESVVVGRALYEGNFTLQEAIAVAGDPGAG